MNDYRMYKQFAKRVELRYPSDDFRENGRLLKQMAESYADMSDWEFHRHVNKHEIVGIIGGFAELLIASGDLVLEIAKKEWKNE